MLRVLFVDDEPNILSGLRRMLFDVADDWECAFAGSGEEALSRVAAEPFDVVVSDMRMPGMDGVALMKALVETHPAIVRIVLSGQSDQDAVMRSVGPAHQFLSKPCDPAVLRDTIGRIHAVRGALSSPKMKALVARLERLPTLPSLYTELLAEMDRPDGSVENVGRIMARDVGMTAKILQLVNSAFFGFRRQITSPAQAAVALGMETLKALVLSAHIFGRQPRKLPKEFGIRRLQDHSVAVGVLAKAIARSVELPPELCDVALVAGMLHDVGHLILAANGADDYAKALRLAHAEGLSHVEAEEHCFGASHASAGAYLLGLWGFPAETLSAVAFHHQPAQGGSPAFRALAAVHVADALQGGAAEEDAAAALVQPPPTGGQLDRDWLDGLGVLDRLPAWEALAAVDRSAEEAA